VFRESPDHAGGQDVDERLVIELVLADRGRVVGLEQRVDCVAAREREHGAGGEDAAGPPEYVCLTHDCRSPLSARRHQKLTFTDAIQRRCIGMAPESAVLKLASPVNATSGSALPSYFVQIHR